MKRKQRGSHPPSQFTIPNERKPELVGLSREVDEGIYTAYTGPCMIPSLSTDSFQETNQMSRCHVIGAQFLELIASHGSILAWPFNGRQSFHAIRSATWSITDAIRPDLDPLRPESIGVNSNPCISPYACQPHDHRVFEAIDAPDIFDLELPQHQFLVSFRGVLGATALAEGTSVTLTEEYKQRTPRHIRRSRDRVIQNQVEALKNQLATSQERVEIVRDELKAWQDMYASDNREAIVSWHATCTTRILLAVSSVVHVPERLPVIASILPAANSDPEARLCDVILTCRSQSLPAEEEAAGTQLQEQARQLKSFGHQLAQALEKDPTDALPELVKALSLNPTSFFFVSPNDYNSLSEERKADIEKEMSDIIRVFVTP